MFIHWLEIGSVRKSLDVENKQWLRLKNYMEKYPDSKATVYYRNSGDLLACVVKLEYKQRYNDLDMIVIPVLSIVSEGLTENHITLNCVGCKQTISLRGQEELIK